MNSTQNSILIVDDMYASLRLLTEMLTEEGYEVRPVPNGSLALSSARADPPDLVLLDIRMPEVDGYTVCEQLKSDERTRDIPVIFISALNETFDKVKAFSLGGVDYITKPFQAEEVVARVRMHLHLQQLRNHLEEKNQELSALNTQLLQEIAERKRAEEALQGSEELLGNIIESMSDGVLVLDRNFHYTYWNQAMEQISKMPRGKTAQ